MFNSAEVVKLNRLVRMNGIFVLLLLLLLFFYSIYHLLTLGFGSENKFHTYVPLVLSITGCFGYFSHINNLFRLDNSFRIAISKTFGFVPHLVSCYCTFYLGLNGIYHSLSKLNLSMGLRGLLFTYMGSKALSKLWYIFEIQQTYLSNFTPWG